MTHYFESILPKVLAYSQKLDKLALLLDEPWVIAGDNQRQTKLIFRTGGGVLISENGTVVFGKWELLNRANSILIEYENSAKLYNHGFFDETVLALKLDGTSDFFVLINENRVPDLNVERYLKEKYINRTRSGENVSNEIPILKTQEYITDKGVITVRFAESWRGYPFNGDNVYKDNKPAPDGKYKIDFMDYIHVENGRVYKMTMF